MITYERFVELLEATEGLGARNRVHRLTNDELADLLDLATGRTGRSAGPPSPPPIGSPAPDSSVRSAW